MPFSSGTYHEHQWYISWSLNNIGEVLYYQGKHREAIPYLEEANGVKRAAGLSSDLINSLELAGLNYMALRDYPSALMN